MTTDWKLPVKQKINTKHGKMTISFHSMQRFYHRMLKMETDWTEEQKQDINFVYEKFIDAFKATKERERRNSVLQMLNHNFQKSKYFVSPEWVFVVNSSNYIQTCYPYEDKGNYKL